MLKLKSYRVQGFRSVQDSGSIETDSVTALIGVNESGKTNLLLPLWKLKPADGGKISPLQDHPRSEYSERRATGGPRVFVSALFEVDEKLRKALIDLTHLPGENFDHVHFERRFDGNYHVRFPDAKVPATANAAEVSQVLAEEKNKIEASEASEVLRAGMLAAISSGEKLLTGPKGAVDQSQIDAIRAKLKEVSTDALSEGPLSELWDGLLGRIDAVAERLGLVHPDNIEAARKLALKHHPAFVYYSNYGNLDSEIYLPHVIQNLKREEAGEDLGTKEAAKARTLRVLFSFVKLKPEEILELGQALKSKNEPTAEQIAAAAEKTKERSVLLQSAGAKLTKAFRNWWKQGNYRFRLEADGDHFRIWVSDDLRPEEVELEARSTGLQWFLSFFLVFLVESEDAHEGAILLLDEPGLSLHPLAQRDLTAFFDGLSKTNQLLYTTHSPFLLDPDRLDQVRCVYVDANGATAASADLRAAKAKSPEFKSVYAVHSALGLSVSEALLQGCTNVIVEGSSDQLYMSAMKIVLIARGKIQPQRELLFLPGGGAKGVTALVPIFAAQDDAPPHVVLDSDAQGIQFAKKLREGTIYIGPYASLIRNVGDILPGLASAEMEDLIPFDVVVNVAGRLYRGEIDFGEVAAEGRPIVPQIEEYAAANGIALELGWKVELARAVKQRLLQSPDKVSDATLELWKTLFEPFAKVSNDAGKRQRRSSRAES